MVQRLRPWGSLLLLALAVSCKSGPAPAPNDLGSPVDLTIVAGSRLNPDDRGQSLPTVIRVYQLRSTAALERADFNRVCREPKEALQADLLRTDEFTMSPGETLSRAIDRDRNARYLVVVALFRKPTGTSWRAVVELGPPSKRLNQGFGIEGYRVETR